MFTESVVQSVSMDHTRWWQYELPETNAQWIHSCMWATLSGHQMLISVTIYRQICRRAKVCIICPECIRVFSAGLCGCLFQCHIPTCVEKIGLAAITREKNCNNSNNIALWIDMCVGCKWRKGNLDMGSLGQHTGRMKSIKGLKIPSMLQICCVTITVLQLCCVTTHYCYFSNLF